MALKTMPPLFQDVAVAAKTKRRERSWNANEQPFIQAFLFSPSSEKRTPSLIIIHDLFPWSLSSLKIAIKCSKEPFWSRTSTRSQTVYNNNKWNPIIQDFFLMIFFFYFHCFQKRNAKLNYSLNSWTCSMVIFQSENCQKSAQKSFLVKTRLKILSV